MDSVQGSLYKKHPTTGNMTELRIAEDDVWVDELPSPAEAKLGKRYIYPGNPSTKIIGALQPDHDYTESVNHYVNDSTPWPVPKDGYVYCEGTAGGANTTFTVMINGKPVRKWPTFAGGQAGGEVEVYQGQLVNILSSVAGATGLRISYIPPRMTLFPDMIKNIVRSNELLTMGPPDYKNMESINRISTNGGTWTVIRDGYVCVQVTASTSDQSVLHIINGHIVGTGMGDIGTPDRGVTSVYAVKKDDVVKLATQTGSYFGSSFCFFVPPVLNPPVYFESFPMLDYSTVEQETGRRDVNGKMIYQRSFVWNNPATIPTQWQTLVTTGLPSQTPILKRECTVQSNEMSLGRIAFDFELLGINTSGELRGYRATPASPAIANTGFITIWYTK